MKKIVLGLICFLAPLSAFAQTGPEDSGLRLVTSPIPLTLSTSPENAITTDLKVKNDGPKAERLKVGTMKFRAYEETGKPALEDLTPEDTFGQWVRFSEQEFDVAPGEWKTIQVTITPPKDAAFGYYYAFVFTRATALEAAPGKAAINGGSAVLVLLDVAVPGAKREVALDSFTTSKKVYEFLPADFLVRLHNTGNVHAAPRGNIFIKNTKREEIALLEVNFEKGNILPSSKRVFESRWKDGFPVYEDRIADNAVVRDENGEIVKDLRWNFNELNNLRFGRYTANLVLAYDDGQRDVPIEGEISFWVMPWRILAGVAALAFILLFGIWAFLRSITRAVRSKK